MKKSLYIILIFILAACTTETLNENQLELALEFAEDNRGELESVLLHYRNDPEKLKAAKFLISNMPHWYSYEGWQLDSIKPVLSYIAHTANVHEMTQKQKTDGRILHSTHYIKCMILRKSQHNILLIILIRLLSLGKNVHGIRN